jgi:hypothetical protein
MPIYELDDFASSHAIERFRTMDARVGQWRA